MVSYRGILADQQMLTKQSRETPEGDKGCPGGGCPPGGSTGGSSLGSTMAGAGGGTPPPQKMASLQLWLVAPPSKKTRNQYIGNNYRLCVTRAMLYMFNIQSHYVSQ